MSGHVPEITKSGIEMYPVRTFDLSYESMTSYTVQEMSKNIQFDDLQF